MKVMDLTEFMLLGDALFSGENNTINLKGRDTLNSEENSTLKSDALLSKEKVVSGKHQGVSNG